MRRFSVPGGGVDLTALTVVVPGGRVGRGLADHMARRAGAVVGGTVTIDGFLDKVLRGRERSAGSWIRRLCWRAAAEELEGEELEALWPASLRESVSQQLAAAATIDQTHTRLAGDGVTFDDVAGVVERMDVPDQPRWRALARLERAYLKRVSRVGRADDATRRIAAAASCGIEPGEVVLVGLAEVPGLVRRVLSRDELKVTALVGAPEDQSDLFDDLGAIRPEAWRDRSLRIKDEAIRVVDGPAEQASLAVAIAGSPSLTGGREKALDPGDVVICVPDDEIRRALERTVMTLEAPADGRLPMRVRAAAGEPCSAAAPARFLRLVAELLADPEFPQFAGVVRHGDVERAITARARDRGVWPLTGERGVLEFIDEYASRYVHGVVDGKWLGPRDKRNAMTHRVLDVVYAQLREILGPLWTGDGTTPKRPVSEWAGAVVAAVRAVYEDSTDAVDEACCVAVEAACRELREGADLGADEPEVSAAAVIQIVLGELGRARRPLPPDAGAVELVGWLEAVHDPAPVMVFTGMNEGIVPRSAVDPLLPEQLRRELKVGSRDVVLARDKYLLEHALACRERAVIIAGRRAQDGTKLWPSRLLVSADDETVVRRLKLFLPAPVTQPRARDVALATAGSDAAAPAFEVMPVGASPRIESVRVTAFKRYMESPYAFYLENVLGLSEACEVPVEMEAGVFGTFIHRVVERFASKAAKEKDAAVIRQAVRDAIDEVAAEDLGGEPPTAVAVQREQAAHRLAGFAEFQIEHATKGWTILRSEWVPDPVVLEVDGRRVSVRGRIDRIDWNPATRELALLDFKTAEGMRAAVKAMYKPGRTPYEWIDLQMPLYRLLAAGLAKECGAEKVVLGYVSLPRSGDVELILGEWEEDALDAGVEAARSLIGEMLRGDWRRPGDAPPTGGAAAAISGVSVLVPRPEGRP
ncbi:MAG: hypothetical protein GIKADHBN_02397 [Phycisphaerales bacterium]|nr:hypothetical protein [Phycisphaerales bacterium]